MDELDAAEIRKWAWEKTIGMTTTRDCEPGERRVLNVRESLEQADEIAAWVMSGQLSAKSVQQEAGP